MPKRTDPSRTTLLTRRFATEIRRRASKLVAAIERWLVEEDELGLVQQPDNRLRLNVRAYQFLGDAQKVQVFRDWLQQQVSGGLLGVDDEGKPWLSKYLDSSYRKGLVNAYLDTKKTKLARNNPAFQGTQEEFLRSTFAQPVRRSKVELLATRAFNEMQGIAGDASKTLGRVLADGMAHGRGARDIAREMRKQIDGTVVPKHRALRIARTEIINAHAEGQLDSFEDLGVEEVGLEAEWLTAGDDKVCPQCSARSGRRYKISEARGLIPLHPNCRCVWRPYVGPLPKDAPEPAADATALTDEQRTKGEALTEQARKYRDVSDQELAWAAGMESTEYFTVRNWTGRGFRVIRKEELAGKGSPILYAALDKAPLETEPLYRGIAVQDQKVFSSLTKKNSVLTLDATSSYSTDKAYATTFTEREGHKVLFVLKEPKTAARISAVSDYPDENEALGRKGTKYKVVGTRRRGDITEVQLEELQ